jgi:hypothetical protein
MTESTSRAQHYHDLALEFLVMMQFTAAAHVRQRYRMMGEHYLARAGAELARAKNDQPARHPEAALGWAKAAEAIEIDRGVAAATPETPPFASAHSGKPTPASPLRQAHSGKPTPASPLRQAHSGKAHSGKAHSGRAGLTA